MPPRTESVIDRVMRVLEAIGEGDRSLSAAEVARRTDLPISTAYRIVEDLVEAQVLERDDRRRVYIGLRLWELVIRSPRVSSLREVALPFMEDLNAVVNQHTTLYIVDKGEVLCLEMLSSKRSNSVNVMRPGSRLPILASAPGIVLAAFSQASVKEEFLKGKITAFTQYTIIDRDVLRKIVAETRKTGFALTSGWIHAESTGLAVPIIGDDGTAVAALSITSRRGEVEDLSLLSALNTSARSISRLLYSGRKTTDPHGKLLRQRIRQAMAPS